MDLKALFYRTYANLPLGLRSEIIAVVENEPLTWNSLKIEVDCNTPIAHKALEKMQKMGILIELKEVE